MIMKEFGYLPLMMQIYQNLREPLLLLKRAPTQTGEPTKVQAKYGRPLVINEVLPADTYRVSQLHPRADGRCYATTAHVSQLKLWTSSCVDDPESSDEEDDGPPGHDGQTNDDGLQDIVEDESDAESEGAVAAVSTRPKRQMKKPMRYND